MWVSKWEQQKKKSYPLFQLSTWTKVKGKCIKYKYLFKETYQSIYQNKKLISLGHV